MAGSGIHATGGGGEVALCAMHMHQNSVQLFMHSGEKIRELSGKDRL